MPSRDSHTPHAVLAGIVSALVGFTSSFAVVLAGLHAVGASSAEAASGLCILSLTMGLGGLVFSCLTRTPITMAWSTPGAAMLAGAVVPSGGFRTAVGAFVLTGCLLAVTGIVRPLARLMGRVPAPLASAMLAGVLLHLCVAPFTSAVRSPREILPVIGTWLLFRVVAPRWAVPAAVMVAGVVIALAGGVRELSAAPVWPSLHLVPPTFSVAGVIALGVPLYLVTMTSQNLPGIGVMRSFGYQVEARLPLLYTGASTVVAALFGGHAINLAAISAALAAGPEAHPDAGRRWIAGASCGASYLLLGLMSSVVVAVAGHAPEGVLAAVAGLALLGTFASSAAIALTDPAWREAAAIALVVGASGVVIWGVGAAFWALVAGGVLSLVSRAARHA